MSTANGTPNGHASGNGAAGSSRVAEFPYLQELMECNRKWAEKGELVEVFETGKKGQWPKTLWIGCADSRVPESVILGQQPGQIFVHRNIANQFQPEDDSANALLDYGVLTVGVEHVIVCGHTGCGGCVAAHGSPLLKGVPGDHLTRFLAPLINLRHSLGESASVDDLIVANVKEAVKAVAATEVMQKSYKLAKDGSGKKVHIHGWVYDVGTGRIRDLGVTVSPP